jgi:hypothetical protein
MLYRTYKPTDCEFDKIMVTSIPSSESTMEFETEDTTTMTPPLVNLLSPDCRSRVFRFLTLFDCLRFAETSRTSLKHVIREVDRRRRDQFLVRPCEELTASGDTILNLSTSIRQSELPPGDALVAHNNDNGNVNDKACDDKTKHDNGSSDHPFLHRAVGHDSDDLYERLQDREIRRSWYVLPSVKERIEGLYRTIPSTHPFNDELRDLVLDLRYYKTIEDSNGRMENSNEQNHNLLKRLSAVTYAHRLHASLLSQCTVNLSPDPYNRHNLNNNRTSNDGNGDNESFTVTLERYMGDVLSARCLIGHSYYFGSRTRSSNNSDGDDSVHMTDSNDDGNNSKNEVVVEGGPSFDQWIDRLVSFKKISSNPTSINTDNEASIEDNNKGDEIPSTKDWYQYWVFFHSALLRISPFSVQQAQQLKLDPCSGILGPFDVYNDMYTQPGPNNIGNDNNNNNNNGDANANTNTTGGQQQQQPWFLPSRTYACFSPECQDVKALSERMNQLFRHNNQRIGILETTLNHFGPLGQFRGRDRVTTEVMLPHKLYVSVLRNSLLSWTLNNRRLQTLLGLNREYITDLRRWLGDSDNRGVMRWMKLLQDQSQKTRPMTVQPPLVTIRMITLNGMERRMAEG